MRHGVIVCGPVGWDTLGGCGEEVEKDTRDRGDTRVYCGLRSCLKSKEALSFIRFLSAQGIGTKSWPERVLN